MVEQTTELSPLDQIRQIEGEVTRKIAAAREASEQILEMARLESEAVKRSASEAGTKEGQARFNELISRATEEANALVVEANDQVRKLRRRGQRQMKAGVSYAVSLVLGLAEETEQ
jgi:vacuolar-type H+-ATPase subunit H